MTKNPEMQPAAEAALPSLNFRVAAVAGRQSTHVRFAPDAEARAAIAAALDLLDLPELRFDGEITPSGKRDMQLAGRLDAVVVQPCGITLEPVTTRIGEVVLRQYLAEFKEPEGEEVEIPEDDTIEPLPDVIDAAAVAIEALALALPLYPRAPGVELGAKVFAPPGAEPLGDADLKPFAGLAGLVAKAKAGGKE
jgi:uncharacterized metal-binding protein YceD (DUF177 family)